MNTNRKSNATYETLQRLLNKKFKKNENVIDVYVGYDYMKKQNVIIVTTKNGITEVHGEKLADAGKKASAIYMSL